MLIENAVDKFSELIRNEKIQFPFRISKIHQNFVAKEVNENDIININDKKDLNFLYIDGGMGQIIKIENNSVYLIRTAHLLRKNDLIETKSYDFYLILSLGDNKINIKIIESNGIFSELNGEHDIDFQTPIFDDIIFNYYSSIIMREAEKIYSIHIAEDALNDGIKIDGLVIDGSLQSSGFKENKFLKEINNFVKVNHLPLIGFSKTHSLKSENGISIHNIMNYIDDKNKCPCYIHLGNVNSADYVSDIYIGKFVKRQPYSFRIDIYNGKNNVDDIMKTFYNYSNNLYIPGYPYTLILIDKNARVMEEELNIIRLKFNEKIMERRPDILNNIKSEGIHDILNIVR